MTISSPRGKIDDRKMYTGIIIFRKKVKYWSLIFFVMIMASQDLFGQGFNTFNSRNHPYLNWQVAETEHFRIIYPDRITGIIPQAAAIAEDSYTALSRNLDVEFSEKIPIYLSDEDEIVNGFANPIGNGYTMIWVNLNDYAETWTGSEKWLRKVIAHELGHIFHFKAVSSDFGLLNYVIAEPLPRVWTEGLAQYQTEYWDSQRGDRWLRKAIFDSRPGYNDGQSIENGRLLYASGNAQLRYFTETYGDSALVNLLSHRDSFLGLEYHDFYKAFDEIVDGGYGEFYEEWRKHMNIYYNTLASRMERTDSLGKELVHLPGQFYDDMAVSPNDSLIAVLSIPALGRPVRTLSISTKDSLGTTHNLSEGAINEDLHWNRDGSTIYFSRMNRGERSSLVNDIYKVDIRSGKEEQITFSRRARYPTDGPGNVLVYVANEDGTGNLFSLDLETGEETRVTNYTGDVQVIHPVWNPYNRSWIFQRFDASGDRHVVLLHSDTGLETILDDGETDNRGFVWSTDGTRVAYTSLRDDVPNVFVYDFFARSETRVTNLFTGGEVVGWLAKNDSVHTERLLIKASETKRRDEAYLIDVGRTPYGETTPVPEPYTSWRKKQAPNLIASEISPNEQLISTKYAYRPIKNLKHAATIVLPYYGDANNWGLFGTTGFVEPLGKHMFAGTGNLSFGDVHNSFGIVSYINKQLYPTITTSIYKTPGSAFFYGNRFLVEELTGGDVTMNLPMDLFEAPYRNGAIFARLRHVSVRPFDSDESLGTMNLPLPERARQTDLTVGVSVKKQRPWKNNIIHPLDGYGVRAMVTGAEKIAGSDVQYGTVDISGYSVLPAFGLQRFYVNGRFQQQWGSPLPQNFVGFSRYDNINLVLPGEVPIQLFHEADRVRGYREFIAGDRVLFGSVEYRVPLLSSLETKILGNIELGSSSLSLFSDGGVVWHAQYDDGSTGTDKRWGAGVELKNELNLFGIGIAHAVGIAQPAQKLFSEADYDLYYRVRAVVPF